MYTQVSYPMRANPAAIYPVNGVKACLLSPNLNQSLKRGAKKISRPTLSSHARLVVGQVITSTDFSTFFSGTPGKSVVQKSPASKVCVNHYQLVQCFFEGITLYSFDCLRIRISFFSFISGSSDCNHCWNKGTWKK